MSDTTRAAVYLGEAEPLLGGFVRDLLREAPAEIEILGASDDPSSPVQVLATMQSDPERVAALLTEEVKWVHVLGTGVDGFPVQMLGDRVLTCSRGASAVAIAEFVVASMLAFEKQFPAAWISSPPPRWGFGAMGGLSGRTVGLVGLGVIGTEVAKRAHAFDMKVLGYRRTDRPAPDGVELTPDLAALLGASDHVVVAVPATPATHHMIGSEQFGAMRQGAHFVNVARGTLVDQEALRTALDSGRVGLASLDVCDPEPLPAGHWLYTHPKVHLTPHASWGGPLTLPRTFAMFGENLARWHGHQALEGIVDVAAGY